MSIFPAFDLLLLYLNVSICGTLGVFIGLPLASPPLELVELSFSAS